MYISSELHAPVNMSIFITFAAYYLYFHLFSGYCIIAYMVSSGAQPIFFWVCARECILVADWQENRCVHTGILGPLTVLICSWHVYLIEIILRLSVN